MPFIYMSTFLSREMYLVSKRVWVRNVALLHLIHDKLHTFLHLSLVRIPGLFHICHWHTMGTEKNVNLYQSALRREFLLLVPLFRSTKSHSYAHLHRQLYLLTSTAQHAVCCKPQGLPHQGTITSLECTSRHVSPKERPGLVYLFRLLKLDKLLLNKRNH